MKRHRQADICLVNGRILVFLLSRHPLQWRQSLDHQVLDIVNTQRRPLIRHSRPLSLSYSALDDAGGIAFAGFAYD
jgi:hypothetical protein